MRKTALWEILVPVMRPAPNERLEQWPLSHHHAWDDRVNAITGGLTLPSRAVSGKWVSSSGTIKEAMIPVHLACSEMEMEMIIEMTKEHYGQEAVMAFVVSTLCLIG